MGIAAQAPARCGLETRSGEDPVLEVSVVMPCLNESQTLSSCIQKAQAALRQHGITGEVVVADNGSTDGSQQIAEQAGARVVHVTEKGYGAALRGGIEAARGKFIIMGDADDSYDFGHAPRFVAKLREGYDLVMGNRFKGGIQPRAMPPLHRYLGNPVLSRIGRIFFKAPCADFHCGMRAFTKAAYQRMDLRTAGMEFASEMIVKSSLLGMRIAEVPTTLVPDGRNRPPHLRTWRDGWRHLRFLLLYSPRWLFLYPGFLFMAIGMIAGAWLLPGPRRIGGVVFDFHSLLYASLSMFLGFQCIAFAVFTKIFAISERLLPPDPRLNRMFRYVTLEVGLTVGIALVLLGLGASVYAVHGWKLHQFGELNPEHTMRVVVPATLALGLGTQIIFSSFFLSVLGMRRR
jgi:glycosyltransferase involved in cell wall biosynthesis